MILTTTSRQWWAILAATAFATPVWAQSRSGELPPYVSSWTGFYLGAAFGGMAAIQHDNSTVNGVTFSNQGVGGQGVLASIYGGYDLPVPAKSPRGVLAERTRRSPPTS